MTTICKPASSAHVDLVAQINASFQDSIQFDPPVAGVTGPAWTLTNQNFRMDIAANYETNTSLLSITSAAGQIVVDDATLRIIHFNVPEATMSAAGLIPGCYVYDLIMFDNSSPAVRVPLMHGKFYMRDGVSGG